MAMSQAIDLLRDQKLAHYLHIDPKGLFLAQLIGTLLGCVTNYVTVKQVIDAKHAYLDGSVADPTAQVSFWFGQQKECSGAETAHSSTVDGKIASGVLFSFGDLGSGRTCSGESCMGGPHHTLH